MHFIPPLDPASSINAETRRLSLDRLSEEPVDVVVIGGGVTGTGVALDAASRGLSVALLERDDLASGTSSKSSKLVHGGLRYLAKGDVGVAWESAVERAHVAGRIAPHLVRPLAQVVPVYRHDRGNGLLAGLGFVAGDILKVAAHTKPGLLPKPRKVGRDRTLSLAPTLDPDGLVGGVVNWDCQLEDDALLTLALARTAAYHGAHVLTRCRISSVNNTGVTFIDGLSGETGSISARWVVNATGVWAGPLDPSLTIQPSRGTHVVVRSAALRGARASLTVAVPQHFGRYVFSLPQSDGTTYLGLTDEVVQGPVPDAVAAPDDDVRWILDIISRPLARPLTMSDVVGTYAGMRPLVLPEGSEEATSDISRKHVVDREDNLITVTGGKLTTYRRMAQDAVDLLTDRPCHTTEIPLVGAGPDPVACDAPDRLRQRYGSEAGTLWTGADGEERRTIVSGYPAHRLEWRFAVEHGLTLTPEDLLDRRTRIGLQPPLRAEAMQAAEQLTAG